MVMDPGGFESILGLLIVAQNLVWQPPLLFFHGCAYPNLQNNPYYGMRIRRSLGDEKGKILD